MDLGFLKRLQSKYVLFTLESLVAWSVGKRIHFKNCIQIS